MGYNQYLQQNVAPSLTKHENTPHFLMELSKFEYETLKNNCIHVSDVRFLKCTASTTPIITTVFGRVDYGRNVNFNVEDNSKILQLDRCKRKIVLVTIDKLECHKCYQDLQILNTLLSSSSSGSGIVVLMMAIKASKLPLEIKDKRIVWARLIIDMCQHCKPNILHSNMVTHHSSRGQIYSFGYQGVFKLVKNSTVGLYEVRKRYIDERQIEVQDIATTIENMISVEMQLATHTLSKIVGHVDQLILPVLDTANKLQSKYGNISLKKRKMIVLLCGILMSVLMHQQENSI